MGSNDETIIEHLKRSVESLVEKTGPHSRFAEDLIQKIGKLQSKMDSLTDVDRHQFVSEMKGSIQEAIARIEKRLLQHTHISQAYTTSIVVAVIFLIVSVIG